MDLTALTLADASCSLVWCSHVLEHIPDDRRAIAEIARVLAPGGVAVIQVPIGGPTTLEDPAVVDPRERARLYWQEDHVRLYGLDLAERLAAAGLAASRLSVADPRRRWSRASGCRCPAATTCSCAAERFDGRLSMRTGVAALRIARIRALSAC